MILRMHSLRSCHDGQGDSPSLGPHLDLLILLLVLDAQAVLLSADNRGPFINSHTRRYGRDVGVLELRFQKRIFHSCSGRPGPRHLVLPFYRNFCFPHSSSLSFSRWNCGSAGLVPVPRRLPFTMAKSSVWAYRCAEFLGERRTKFRADLSPPTGGGEIRTSSNPGVRIPNRNQIYWNWQRNGTSSLAPPTGVLKIWISGNETN